MPMVSIDSSNIRPTSATKALETVQTRVSSAGRWARGWRVDGLLTGAFLFGESRWFPWQR